MDVCFDRSTKCGTSVFACSKNNARQKLRNNLLSSKPRACGRNHRGLITCRGRGGGAKRRYRKIDFLRTKPGNTGFVHSVIADPNRNAKIALINYPSGKKGLILAPTGLVCGRIVTTDFHATIERGNSLPLWNVPLGTRVHNLEFHPGAGGKLARAAGTSACLLAKENGFVTIRLPSNEVRLVSQTCWATVGSVGNSDFVNEKIRKAGSGRWIGLRPTVRGSAINPVDHPHGGGEGRCSIGRSCPLTPWGKIRLGKKTRRSRKYSDTRIVRRRKLL